MLFSRGEDILPEEVEAIENHEIIDTERRNILA